MENKLFDVTALGELLIDFTENGISGQELRAWLCTSAKGGQNGTD